MTDPLANEETAEYCYADAHAMIAP